MCQSEAQKYRRGSLEATQGLWLRRVHLPWASALMGEYLRASPGSATQRAAWLPSGVAVCDTWLTSSAPIRKKLDPDDHQGKGPASGKATAEARPDGAGDSDSFCPSAPEYTFGCNPNHKHFRTQRGGLGDHVSQTRPTRSGRLADLEAPGATGTE